MFDLYGDDSGALLMLDPRTKLAILVMTGFASMYAFGDRSVLTMGGALCALVALCGKPSFALKALAGMAAVVWLRYWMVSSGTGAEGIVMILATIVSVALFVLPFMLALALLVQTTRISHLIAALQAMHLPLAVIIPLAVLIRFIPAVQDEWTGIRKAMAFRGIHVDLAAVVKAPFRTVEYVLVPLLFSTISMMDELASASLARGLDSDRARTSLEEVGMDVIDYVVLVLFCGMAAVVLTVFRPVGAA